MAWDQTKPAASAYVVSADLRSNFAAIADQALGKNLLGDPEQIIWAEGITASAPTWWNATPAAAQFARFSTSSTSIKVPGGKGATKLTYSASTLTLHQNVLSTGDMSTSIRKSLIGQSISAGAWVYTNSADCKLILQGPSSNVLSSTVTTGSWQWWTQTLTLTTKFVRLGMGIRLNAAGFAYIASPTLVLGPIPPDYSIPGESRRKELTITVPSTTPITGNKIAWRPTYPCRIDGIAVSAVTVPTCNVIFDFDKYNGTSYVRVIATGMAINTGAHNEARADGAYDQRCLTRPASAADLTNTLFRLSISKASASGPTNPTFRIAYTTYDPPLQPLRANETIYK